MVSRHAWLARRHPYCFVLELLYTTVTGEGAGLNILGALDKYVDVDPSAFGYHGLAPRCGAFGFP